MKKIDRAISSFVKTASRKASKEAIKLLMNILKNSYNRFSSVNTNYSSAEDIERIIDDIDYSLRELSINLSLRNKHHIISRILKNQPALVDIECFDYIKERHILDDKCILLNPNNNKIEILWFDFVKEEPVTIKEKPLADIIKVEPTHAAITHQEMMDRENEEE